MKIANWLSAPRDGVRVISSLTLCEEQDAAGTTRAHNYTLDEGAESPRYTVWEIDKAFQATQVFPKP